MILFIICLSLFLIGLILFLFCVFMDWSKEVSILITVLLLISGPGTIISAKFIAPTIKVIEYPASEYDFKIKVVEFEEHRDTILVVIPKEKIK